ncbi:MAG TPA: hypothetical protein VM621_17695 [Luteibacter sp.]|uniref:hypothetical protein n=1 Tax=Luteibacter sp. TaxID=1886636 RepID=UPI002CA8163D|nr:hypothetical protein [Luteibacter sp.]HVI56877.1 hypothetical protein [Luteibacter sp.]
MIGRPGSVSVSRCGYIDTDTDTCVIAASGSVALGQGSITFLEEFLVAPSNDTFVIKKQTYWDAALV